MSEVSKDTSKANSIKEKFMAQKRAIEQYKARITELEALLVGPTVAEISIQSNCLIDQNILSLSHSPNNSNFTISPDQLLAGEKIKELEILTSSLQDNIRKVTIQNEENIANVKKELDNSQKKCNQLESTNSSLQKEIDRLTASQTDFQSEIRKLKADVSEKQNNIERLQNSQRRLTRENSDIDSLQRERDELQKLLNESNKARIKNEDQINSLIQRNSKIEAEKAQSERKLRNELAELGKKLAQSVEKEKVAGNKINSSDNATKRAFQRIAECESMISSLQASNTKLTQENVKLMTELSQTNVKMHELSLPGENVQSLKNQVSSLKKEIISLRENLSKSEAKYIASEKRAEMLSSDLQRMSESVSKSFGSESVEDAVASMKTLKNELRNSQKETSELRAQLSQANIIKAESSELVKKNAELQHSIDFIESRVGYVKQVVKQLLTSPYNQRQKIIELLVDILEYGAEEKATILKASSQGKDLSSRLLYAFEPWV
ncbi:hypothetical protein TRFO_22381 [Tritrichomonas foetus]|uniref:GRIP domain-containing protein n=1 Tax=Tritrichomonas foetus TaxID=1144522 RepID=A0A1J4KBW3_9EUKA|nr:hypothetical protein TRFO_22381 [Tritrichomonas foetus]|eukprot:OHT08897.1 hypothetical protein TRFO_22381 [Tritrichomonas foetus]